MNDRALGNIPYALGRWWQCGFLFSLSFHLALAVRLAWIRHSSTPLAPLPRKARMASRNSAGQSVGRY